MSSLLNSGTLSSSFTRTMQPISVDAEPAGGGTHHRQLPNLSEYDAAADADALLDRDDSFE